MKAIYPVETIALPPPPMAGAGDAADLFASLAMIGADVAQCELGYTGSGVKVAVMDTGIDYDHADLGGDGIARSNSPQLPRVARDRRVGLRRRRLQRRLVVRVVQPDPHARCLSRTTAPATAPTSPASSARTAPSRALRPSVTFGAYRVFGCEGSTTEPTS